MAIVRSFGNLKTNEVEDIVQTMYLLLHKNTQKGLNIMYNDTEVNYWYIYRILKGLHIDLIRKKSKVKICRIETNEHNLNSYVRSQQEPNYVEKYEEIQNALKDMYWYDAKVYEIIEAGESISELSRKTNISYYSLYNTYKRVKEKLKQYI